MEKETTIQQAEEISRYLGPILSESLLKTVREEFGKALADHRAGVHADMVRLETILHSHSVRISRLETLKIRALTLWAVALVAFDALKDWWIYTHAK